MNCACTRKHGMRDMLLANPARQVKVVNNHLRSKDGWIEATICMNHKEYAIFYKD